MTALSPAEKLAALPPDEREAAKRQLKDRLGPAGVARLKYEWKFWARPGQLPPPGSWFVFLILSGRGYGKSRAGAEFIKAKVMSGESKRPRLIARTSADIRNTMVEGESGLLAVSPPDFRPRYVQTTGELHWPNGAIGLCYSAEEPDRLRGPQCDVFWCDEIGSWGSTQGRNNARIQELSWKMHTLGCRIGPRPHGIVTTTPSDTPIIRDLLKRVGKDVVLTRGTSYENRSNLADSFWDQVIAPFEGTPLGRQEIYAEVLNLSGEGFISGTWIEAATALDLFGKRSQEALDAMPLDLGCDIAGRTLGGDDTVITAVRDGGAVGKRQEWLERYSGNDTMRTCGELCAIIRDEKPRSLRIDDTGIGNGVTDRLFELQAEPGCNRYLKACEIIPFNFGSRAFDDERFADVRTELWFDTGELLRTGKLDLLAEEYDVHAELARPAMGKSSNGRLKLESKETLKARGVDSPDAADALTLAAYDDAKLGGSGGW